MAQYDAAAVRQRLEAERERLKFDIHQLTLGDEAVVPVDPVSDEGGLASEQADNADAMADVERNQAMVRNARVLLDQVNAALARLDAGTYGICQNCGREISPRRLEVLPYATLCVDCQAKMERR